MDFSQLLNTSTPFDQTKLNLLEQVINVFYTTINNQDVRIFFLLIKNHSDKLQINY